MNQPVGLLIQRLALFAGVTLAGALSASPARAQVPVTFTLERPGYVTLVIEDQSGQRIHNLIQHTRFDAGAHTVQWDGYDLGRRVSITRPGTKRTESFYDIHRSLVAPGTYRVRGLVHDGMQLRYELSVQSPGTPPWHTPTGSGAWLSDHGAPTAALSLPQGSPHGRQPQVILGAPVAETGHGLIWVDLDGRKLFGQKVQGWQGSLVLAADAGPRPNPAFYAFSAADRRGKLHLHGLRVEPRDGDATASLGALDLPGASRLEAVRIGMAAWNGILVVSRPKHGEIVFLNTARGGKQIGQAAVDDPRGLAFDRNGGLYVLSGRNLLHYPKPDPAAGQLGAPRRLAVELEDPQRITVGPDGRLYVSDWGSRHQVLVLDATGKLLRTIGKPGGPQLGRYDEQRMHHPAGVAVDAKGQVWVTEADYAPKRISRWTSSGAFDRAFYGPPKYGGGGFIDPLDPSRFYYAGGLQGIEFHLDWQTGTSKPAAIYYLRRDDEVGAASPDYPIHLDGRQYLANCFAVRPFGWKAADASLFLYDRDRGVVEHVARVGCIEDFLKKAAERDPALAGRLIADKGQSKFNFYAWSDVNHDDVPQADEVQAYAIRDEKMASRPSGGVAFNRDLSVITSAGLFVPPPKITAHGVPVWDLGAAKLVTPTGAYQADVLQTADGFTILTGGPIAGYRGGQLAWAYHSQWPKRGGPQAPPPSYPGQLVATSRVIGDTIRPTDGEAGEVWAINSDKGSIYLLSSDGLFIAELGGDLRITPPLHVPEAKRGMILPQVSFNDEHFWPSITQMADGRVLLTIGKEHSSLFTLLGLENVRRLKAADVEVRPEMLAGKPPELVEPAVLTQRKEWTITLGGRAPSMSGREEDWADAQWQTIDTRLGIRAALKVHDQTLYVAWHAPADLLRNALPDGWEHAFATGGALDLMVRTRPSDQTPEMQRRHREHETAAPGDVRLLVTRTGGAGDGRVLAVRYEQEAAGRADNPVLFVSPVGRVQFDSVTDVSGQVRLVQKGELYELAVPLSVLRLEAKPGLRTLGDVGVLIGDGRDTYARIYWNSRQAGITTDIPSEARLTPEAWGQWVMQSKEGP